MSSGRYRLIALHGFLGSSADWDGFGGLFPGAQWDGVDVWSLFSQSTVSDWPSIGRALRERLSARPGEDALPTIVLGYSFGARLALSVAELGAADSPFAGACLVSCHPGLADGDDGARRERKAADEAWARRFVEAPVVRIWKEWDAQPIFAGTAVPGRPDRLPAPRVTIARAMRVASLATQPDRRPLLARWRRPLLWVHGERDGKFRQLSEALAGEGIPATFFSCEHAGHRVPWDNPIGFAAGFQEWVDGVLGAD